MHHFNQLSLDLQQNVNDMVQRCIARGIFRPEDKQAHTEKLAYCLLFVNISEAHSQDESVLVQYLHEGKPYSFYLSNHPQAVN